MGCETNREGTRGRRGGSRGSYSHQVQEGELRSDYEDMKEIVENPAVFLQTAGVVLENANGLPGLVASHNSNQQRRSLLVGRHVYLITSTHNKAAETEVTQFKAAKIEAAKVEAALDWGVPLRNLKLTYKEAHSCNSTSEIFPF